MVGKNTLIINQGEMVRAINMYFKQLVGSCGERGYAEVVSVRQKGAQMQQEFIIEIAEKHSEPKG